MLGDVPGSSAQVSALERKKPAAAVAGLVSKIIPASRMCSAVAIAPITLIRYHPGYQWSIFRCCRCTAAEGVFVGRWQPLIFLSTPYRFGFQVWCSVLSRACRLHLLIALHLIGIIAIPLLARLVVISICFAMSLWVWSTWQLATRALRPIQPLGLLSGRVSRCRSRPLHLRSGLVKFRG